MITPVWQSALKQAAHYSNFMSNLTPDIRINKNGVPVKKYVRTDPKTGSDAVAKLPIPSSGTNTPRPATPLLLEEFKRTVLTSDFTLDDLDPDAVQELESLMKYDEEQSPKLYNMQSAFRHGLDTLEGEARIAFLHNVAVFGGAVQGCKSGTYTTYVNGLDQYPDSMLYHGIDYLLDAPEKTMERAQHLLAFTAKAAQEVNDALIYDSFMETWDSDSGVTEVYTILRDAELAAYIMDHPERGDEIIEMTKTDGALPMETIAARFDLGVPSLSEGML